MSERRRGTVTKAERQAREDHRDTGRRAFEALPTCHVCGWLAPHHAEDCTEPRDAEIACLRAEVERLTREREEPCRWTTHASMPSGYYPECKEGAADYDELRYHPNAREFTVCPYCAKPLIVEAPDA